MDEQRATTGEGLDGRRGEPAHQGHGNSASGDRDLHIDDAHRWRLRAVPGAARGSDRTGWGMGTGHAHPARLDGWNLAQDRYQHRRFKAQAVRADHPADGFHALRVRGSRRAHRSVASRSVPFLERLPAYRRRSQSNQPLRDRARRALRDNSQQILLRELPPYLPGGARIKSAGTSPPRSKARRALAKGGAATRRLLFPECRYSFASGEKCALTIFHWEPRFTNTQVVRPH